MPKKSLATLPCSRRSLLQVLGFGAAGALVLSACSTGANLPSATSSACGTGTCIDLTDASNVDLTKVGGAMAIDLDRDTIIVVRVSDTEVIALSAVCTHAGCIVDYNASADRIDCNCHGSQFSTTGQVLRGPAGRPLKMYTAALANNTITVS